MLDLTTDTCHTNTSTTLIRGFPKGSKSHPALIIHNMPVHVPKPTVAAPPPASGLVTPGQAPNTNDERIFGTTQRFRVGYAERIGFRDKMEDAISIVGSFRNNSDEDYFAVFDGHSGETASKFCAKKLHTFLEKRLNEKTDAYQSLKLAFADCQSTMKSINIDCGTTSVVAYFSGDFLYIANCGDSRAVISQQKRSKTITIDHKPSLESEKKRIESIPGGYIHKNRVQGKLAVSRSLGDFLLNPYVSYEPDIFGPFPIKEYELLILACDGLWDVTSEEEAVQVALTSETPQDAAARLRDEAYDKRSRDNISVVVIWFPGFVPEVRKKESSCEESEEGSGSGSESESGSGSGEEEDEDESGESTPREKENTPRETVNTPRDKVNTPREIGNPREKAPIPREKVPIPLEKISAPLEKVTSPREKASTPREIVTTPREKLITPREKASTPLEKLNITREKVTIPREKISLDLSDKTPRENGRTPRGQSKTPRGQGKIREQQLSPCAVIVNPPKPTTNGKSPVASTPVSPRPQTQQLAPPPFRTAVSVRGVIPNISPPKRTQSWSLPTSPQKKAHTGYANSPLPKWKQDQLIREQIQRDRMEADRLMKLREIRKIATRASQSGNPSASAQTLAAETPRQNIQ